MSQLIPTAVPLQDLLTSGSKINTENDGIETQEVSPRVPGRYEQPITVQVTDDPLSYRIAEGVADADVLNTISDSTADFVTAGVAIGDTAVSKVSGASALITAVTDLNNVVTGTTDLLPLGTEGYFIVAAADLGFWTQETLTGEWKRSDIKDGNNVRVTYVLPTPGTATSVVVHQVVVPVAAPEDTGNYPPAANF